MRDGNSRKAQVEFACFGPSSVLGGSSHNLPVAANSNRAGRKADFPFGYNPTAVAEAERLAVEAMYLGADILDMLKRLNVELSRELSADTARLAKSLMVWGVGAAAISGEKH